MNGIEIIDYNGEGYEPAVRFEAWRAAYLRYADCYDNITQLERHNLTDEVFMLLEGEATLIIGKEMREVPMEKHKIYNVKKGIYHNIRVSRDAKVFIVENDNTARENSDYISVAELKKIKLG